MGVVAVPLDSHDHGTDFHWSADLRKQETENGEMLVASVVMGFSDGGGDRSTAGQ